MSDDSEPQQGETTKKPTHKSADQWEIDAISRFLLDLYHQQVITKRSDFLVPKHRMRYEFEQNFLKLPENAEIKEKFHELKEALNIGKILYRTDFILNTARGSDFYRIKNASLFRYRNEKLKKWDDQRINGDNLILGGAAAQSNENGIEGDLVDHDGDLVDPAIKELHKVADDAPSFPLSYEGSSIERHKDDFNLSNVGCFICQRNFENPEDYEQHVQWHGDDSDFESLRSLKKLTNSFFKLSYQLCKDSHYFCFTMCTSEQNVIIEKIILVQSRSMIYVHNSRVPYELSQSCDEKFFLDSHLFTIFVEQPIVIVFRYKSNEAMRIVEQHHFMRSESFPSVNFSIKANRLPYKSTFKTKFELLRYLPPDEIKLALKSEFSTESLCNISNEFSEYLNNEQQFKSHNMTHVMNTLLQIEDMDGIQKYASLVQHNAKFRCFNDEYSFKLKVNGRFFVENVLSQYDEVMIIPESENIESTLGKDAVSMDLLLKTTDDFDKKSRKKKCHYGIVERVNSNRVTFKTDKKLSDKETYKVIFRPARLVLRYQYRAIQYLNELTPLERKRFFFPESIFEQSTESISLQVSQESIANNKEQLQAVLNIATGPKKHAPYIIFGPPGTGKTTTVVEAILQLYKQKDKKILVTAGSNSACDEVALRLCQLLEKVDDARAIVRIYAKSNEKRLETIDDLLLEASNMYGAHFYPDIEILHSYRIIICTLSVVGKLATGKFGRGDSGNSIFTHIFVDEAAASTEAETLVGVVSSISANTRLILAGDHKQLGPILQSERAHELGLGVSLMERLLKRSCYSVHEDGNYDKSIQTRLRRNYRSHSEIVKLYSELYYNGELLPLAYGDEVNLGSKWHHSPNPNFPIMFHSVFGQISRERNSVSLYNDKELDVVLYYVKDLLCYGIAGQPVKQTDIGIISPYKKQYLRIREELNLRHLYQIETGSVETFQGKEKQIIIVSFVRSFTSTLGFLDSPQRLNVTLSRAKSLLILIGNPKTLSINADFRQIVEKCRQEKTMVGANYYENLPTDGSELPKLMDLKLDMKNNNAANKRRQQNSAAQQKANGKQRFNNKNRKNKSKATTATDDSNTKSSAGGGDNLLPQQPQLRKSMKKRKSPPNNTFWWWRQKPQKVATVVSCIKDVGINAVSQQNQKEKFDKFQRLVKKDDAAATVALETEMDLLFNSLPSVPAGFSNEKQQQLQQQQHQQQLRNKAAEKEESFIKMRQEMHERMAKLKLTPPGAAARTTEIKTTTRTDNLRNSNIEPQLARTTAACSIMRQNIATSFVAASADNQHKYATTNGAAAASATTATYAGRTPKTTFDDYIHSINAFNARTVEVQQPTAPPTPTTPPTTPIATHNARFSAPNTPYNVAANNPYNVAATMARNVAATSSSTRPATINSSSSNSPYIENAANVQYSNHTEITRQNIQTEINRQRLENERRRLANEERERRILEAERMESLRRKVQKKDDCTIL